MLTSEILSPFSNIEDQLRKIIDYLQGFLFLGTTPIGRVAENLVYITEVKSGNIVEFPFAITNLEIYTDTTLTTKVNFRQLSPKEIELPTFELAKLKKIGDKYLLFISRLETVGDNLWTAYGKHLFDYFMDDSIQYREILLSFLRFFVLGPTLNGVTGVATGAKAKDYIANGEWWDGLFLPYNIVEVKERVPRIGVSLKEGDRLPYDDLLSNSEFLSRFAKNFGEAYFDQKPPLHFQRPGEPLSYVFGGKTVAYLLFEKLLKYHTFLLQVYDIPKKEEFYKRIEAIKEGRPTHTTPFLAGWADFEDEIKGGLDELTQVEVHLKVKDYTPRWVFNANEGYFFNKFEYTRNVNCKFNEENLYFDLGRFVHLDGKEISPRLYDLYFDKSGATFDERPPKRFDQHASKVVPYGHGLIFFDGRFTEHRDTPYYFNVAPTFADSGIKIDRFVTFTDEFRQSISDTLVLETSLHAQITAGANITQYPVTVVGSFQTIVQYDIDPTNREITTTYDTPKGKLGIFRLEEEFDSKISSDFGTNVYFNSSNYTFGGEVRKPKYLFNTSLLFDHPHRESRFDEVMIQTFSGSALVFSTSQNDSLAGQEVVAFPFVGFSEEKSISFAEEVSVEVQT